MGNWKAVTRKRRKHPAIEKGSKIFADAVHAGDCKKAAAIAIWTALEVRPGVIMVGIEHANAFVMRRSDRRGL